MLIIWLQGIYLPRHGYSYSETPLWAGIYLLPLVAGMLFAGPIAGALSDRMGPRPFAVSGMALAALSFLLLTLLPVNFSYPVFALVIILNGLGMGIFFSPNRASIMNSLPANQRGAGGGMAATFMNSAMVLSIGIFFSLMIVGLSGGLHHSLYESLRAHGVANAAAAKAANLPPVATLFAAFLGYNPIQTRSSPPRSPPPCPRRSRSAWPPASSRGWRHSCRPRASRSSAAAAAPASPSPTPRISS